MNSPGAVPSIRSLEDLMAAWESRRRDAERMHATAPIATVLAVVMAELDAARRAADDEALTLEEAAAASGYSAETLRHKVATGEIPNAGKRGAPRLRRRDLPRKARKASGGGYDPSADALALVRRSGTLR